MKWQVILTREAEKDLDDLDSSIRNRIVQKLVWMRDNFDTVVPIPLGGLWRGFFKLRVGDWRVIYEIETKKRIVIIHQLGLRDKIYKLK